MVVCDNVCVMVVVEIVWSYVVVCIVNLVLVVNICVFGL